MSTRPKAFISHASEDKERFVLPFATRLRASGVDAWVDKWEISLGDSIVERIFDEGLAQADAFIIVVSPFSIDKPWVREELNQAVVRNIENATRLIPVILEGAVVPEPLRTKVWIRIESLNAYNREFDEIVSAILGTRHKPPIGEPPRHLAEPLPSPPGLSAADTRVLRMLVEMVLEDECEVINTPKLIARLAPDGLAQETIIDAAQILRDKHFVEILGHANTPGTVLQVRSPAFRWYVAAVRGGGADLMRRVGLSILNDGLEHGAAIASALGESEVLVFWALEEWRLRGAIKTVSSKHSEAKSNRTVHVFHVSPILRRSLQNAEQP